MPNLILVRHSLPEIVPTVATSRWHLSEKGRRRCIPLAAELAPLQPDVFLSSMEPKAIETGQALASRLDRRVELADGLHEHLRATVPYGSRERFEQSIARFFAQPAQLVFGSETADQAHKRFTYAITTIIEKYPTKTVAVVTHGTVMALFVSRAVGLEPFPFWKRLGLPAFVVLSLPEFRLARIVEHINAED